MGSPTRRRAVFWPTLQWAVAALVALALPKMAGALRPQDIDHRNEMYTAEELKSLGMYDGPMHYGFASVCELNVARFYCALATGIDPVCSTGLVQRCLKLKDHCVGFEVEDCQVPEPEMCCGCSFKECPLGEMGCFLMARKCADVDGRVFNADFELARVRGSVAAGRTPISMRHHGGAVRRRPRPNKAGARRPPPVCDAHVGSNACAMGKYFGENPGKASVVYPEGVTDKEQHKNFSAEVLKKYLLATLKEWHAHEELAKKATGEAPSMSCLEVGDPPKKYCAADVTGS